MKQEPPNVRALLARRAAHDLGDLLYQKQVAYGDARRKVFAILEILYADHRDENGNYVLSPSVLRDIVTLVRMGDRLSRLASHKKDPMGEDPFVDLAGDAIIGHVARLPEVEHVEDAESISHMPPEVQEIIRRGEAIEDAFGT